MKHIATTTALATAFALGIASAPFAQSVNPNNPSSASGGVMAQGQTGASSPAQTGTAARVEMSEGQIRSILQARGYTDISGMERDGDHFKIEEAKRYGRDVEDVRVNARTGQVRDEERLNEDQARKLLEDRGYSDVSDVSRDGDTITAKAKRDDRDVEVRINAETGVVMPQASN